MRFLVSKTEERSHARTCRSTERNYCSKMLVRRRRLDPTRSQRTEELVANEVVGCPIRRRADDRPRERAVDGRWYTSRCCPVGLLLGAPSIMSRTVAMVERSRGFSLRCSWRYCCTTFGGSANPSSRSRSHSSSLIGCGPRVWTRRLSSPQPGSRVTSTGHASIPGSAYTANSSLQPALGPALWTARSLRTPL